MRIEEHRITLRATVAVVALALVLVAGLTAAQAPPAERVVLDTSLGQIEIEVDRARAPQAAAAFLRYVDRGLFEDGAFERAGTGGKSGPAVALVEAAVDPSRRDEASQTAAIEGQNGPGVPLQPGSVSLARSSFDGGVSDLVIRLSAPESGERLAPFGMVVRGLDIVRRIGAGPTHGQRLIQPVRILRIRRVHEEAP